MGIARQEGLGQSLRRHPRKVEKRSPPGLATKKTTKRKQDMMINIAFIPPAPEVASWLFGAGVLVVLAIEILRRRSAHKKVNGSE